MSTPARATENDQAIKLLNLARNSLLEASREITDPSLADEAAELHARVSKLAKKAWSV